MTPRKSDPKHATKVDPIRRLYGVIDMMTPPDKPAYPGTTRGYCVTGIGFNTLTGYAEPWWANPERTDVLLVQLLRSLDAYAPRSIIGLDIEHPWITNRNKTTPEHAKLSINVIAGVIGAIRAVRPDLIVGAYETVPGMYWERSPEQLAAWRAAADESKPIINAADIVMPTCYLHYDADDQNDEQDIHWDGVNIENEAGYAVKLAGAKPVIAWVSHRIYDRDMTKSDYVSPKRARAAMEKLKSVGVQGVAVWEYTAGEPLTPHQVEFMEICLDVFGGREA